MLRFTGGPPDHEYGWAETELSNRTTTPDVAGWRPACVCGWQGPHLHRRRDPGADQPSESARLAVAAEWEVHLTGVEALATLLAALDEHQATTDRPDRHDDAATAEALAEAVQSARQWLTWQQIADGLGTTRQAAHQRLAKVLRSRKPPTELFGSGRKCSRG